jgi:hypothetical protein
MAIRGLPNPPQHGLPTVPMDPHSIVRTKTESAVGLSEYHTVNNNHYD